MLENQEAYKPPKAKAENNLKASNG